MTATTSDATTHPTSDFVITREFKAPRELVFKAWSEAERLAQWWGPKGFKLTVHTLEFRPGGRFHYGMNGPNNAVMWGLFVYHDITAPERVTWVSSFADEAGNITQSPFGGEWPLEVMNLLTLTEKDGLTTLTLRGGPMNATEEQVKAYAAMHTSMQQGFGGTFDQLDAYLANAQA